MYPSDFKHGLSNSLSPDFVDKTLTALNNW